MRRFYINPLPNSGIELRKQFVSLVKKSFFPTNGSTVCHYFDVNPYAVPRNGNLFDGVFVGYVTEDGERWNLFIENTPGSSQIVFGATEYALRIERVNEL